MADEQPPASVPADFTKRPRKLVMNPQPMVIRETGRLPKAERGMRTEAEVRARIADLEARLNSGKRITGRDFLAVQLVALRWALGEPWPGED